MPDLYRDPAAGIGERVTDLLGRMTIEEKVAQLGAIWLTALVRDGDLDADRVAGKLADGIGQVTRIGASTGLTADASARLGNEIQRVLVERTRLGIPTVIQEVIFRGASVHVALAAADGTEVVAHLVDDRSLDGLRPGDSAWATWERADGYLVPADAGHSAPSPHPLVETTTP